MLFGWNRTSRNIFRLLPVAQPPKSQSHSRKVPSPVDASTRGSWRGGNPLFWQQHWSILIHAQSAVQELDQKIHKHPKISARQQAVLDAPAVSSQVSGFRAVIVGTTMVRWSPARCIGLCLCSPGLGIVLRLLWWRANLHTLLKHVYQ